MGIEFEWDVGKAAANRSNHGVGFEHAAKAFRDPFAVEWIDDRDQYAEERINTLGVCDGTVLHVTYTERDGKIRIISTRRATKREKEKYYSENAS
jgi:uncharacterized DUF497 family protein